MKTLLLLLILILNLSQTNIRAIDGVVYDIDGDLIIVDTSDENCWDFQTSNAALNIGDSVIVIFDTLGDDDMYNDEIISIVKISE